MESANLLVPITLALFVPAALGLVAWLGPRRGVVVSLLAGWLLLPSFDGKIAVPFLATKAMFVPVVVLGAALAFDLRNWQRLRPRWIDVPMVVFCAEPFVTSMVNGLGAYDGAQAVFQITSTWGVPYLLGRVYLGTPRAIGELADGLVLAALAYVPLALWEVRMSPNLHLWTYGYHPMDFLQAVRFGGFRPNVFLSHGLMLGMVMSTASLVAWWLWRTRARTRLLGLSYGWWVAVLVGTTVLAKSTGAILLLIAGIAVMEGTRRLAAPWLVLALLLAPSGYAAARIAGWSGEGILELSERWVDTDRASSLKYRMDNEDALVAKAMERPGLGWGRWGRSRIYDEDGRDISVTDGMWIITLGVSGLVGLVALALFQALPALALLRRFPSRFWGDPRIAAAAALAVAVLLWAVDNVLNAMVTPLPQLMAGAVIALSRVPREAPRRRARAVAARPAAAATRAPAPVQGT